MCRRSSASSACNLVAMDEHEQMVCAMAADLGRAGMLPESVQRMNKAALEAIANGALRLGPLSVRLVNEMPAGVAVLGDGETPPINITNWE
jgi:hypothetical protein